MRIKGWMVAETGAPMVLEEREETPGPGQVLVKVAGCGLCHTDLGFYYDGVPTRHPFPLTLGHEISGSVVAAGPGAEDWVGRQVIVPAVIPCGDCDACRAGRGSICPKQIFPGNDVNGGFGTHVIVPANGLCLVREVNGKSQSSRQEYLSSLSVIADAVSTPYQAIVRSELASGDLAVFVGAGGVGGFGVQIAAARGAAVVAIDIAQENLNRISEHGADLALRADQLDFKQLRKELQAFAKQRRIPTWRQKIFETSGTPEGQTTAFGLLGHGGYLSVIGFTPQKVQIRLSNLMALDARAEGNWGCLPEHYPAILELVMSGKIALEPFIERRPLSSINQAIASVHEKGTSRRIIFVPEGES